MARALVFGAVTLTVIAMAPVIVLLGEPLRRYYLRRLSRSPLRWHAAGVRGGFARAVIANPVLIALTAPGRWAIDRVGGLTSGSTTGGDWPPSAGVREPRTPRPNAPAGAIALAEPRQRHRTIPIRKALPHALSEPLSKPLSEPIRRARSRLAHVAGMARALRTAINRRLLRRPRPA